MNTTTRITTAERFGRWLGRGWRGYMRGERRVSAVLVAKGVPIAVAAVLLWVVKLAALGMLLYVAFWIALLLVFIIAAAWTLKQQHSEDKQYEWQYPAIEELREMPGYDPNLHNDSAHEAYRNE